jgi:uncharacterized protein (TIGR01244 family)
LLKRLRTAFSRRFFPDREQFREPLRDDVGQRAESSALNRRTEGLSSSRRAEVLFSNRRAAWFDFLVVDFGFLRFFWKNRARLSPRAWRMNQPYPSDIDWAARQGIRTVITTRHDPRHGGHALEREACERQGLTYVTLPFFSREAPSRAAIADAAALLASVEYPILIHCKSGADRAGFLSALYLIVEEGVPVAEARHQLSLRHFHFRTSRTGILDAVFDAYVAAHPDGNPGFLAWAASEYDPAAVTEAFRHNWFSDLVDRLILRHE